MNAPPRSSAGPSRAPSPWRRLLLLLTLIALGLSLLWWIDPRRSPLPLCGFHNLTGLHCPGCGITRATHELLHGRLASAFDYHPLWIILLPLVLYTGLSEAMRFVVGRRLPLDMLRKPWFFGLVVAAAFVFGILRNLPWEPFCHWAPPG